MTETFRSPYPEWDVLSKWDSPSYNEQTREVLRHRLQIPERRALELAEFAALEALCERIIPQEGPDQVEIAPAIDAAIAEARPTGTRYDGMPDNPTAWRQGLRALDAEAKARGVESFAAMEGGARDTLLKEIDKGDVKSEEAWGSMPPQTFFRHVALKQIVSYYYAHPRAQSEIGYGGPASPRGYVRLGGGRLDSWEAPPGEWSEASTGSTR